MPDQEDPELAAAIAAATGLDAAALNALRAWIDARLAAAPEPVLSEREAEVTRRIALGYSNKEIAARLAVSVKSVEKYKARALEKLGVRTRPALVRYALRRGWLGAPDAGADDSP